MSRALDLCTPRLAVPHNAFGVSCWRRESRECLRRVLLPSHMTAVKRLGIVTVNDTVRSPPSCRYETLPAPQGG
jgi:hypothetical protein